MREKRTNGEVTCGKEETSHLNCWTKFGREREKKRKEEKRSAKLHLLSKFDGDRTIDFRLSKRQSPSTRRKLHIGTRIWGFGQTPRARDFPPTWVIFGLRAIKMP